jgi:hypothetical protein
MEFDLKTRIANAKETLTDTKEVLKDEEMQTVFKAAGLTLFKGFLPVISTMNAKRVWNRHVRHIRPGEPVTFKQASGVMIIFTAITSNVLVTHANFHVIAKALEEANAEAEKYREDHKTRGEPQKEWSELWQRPPSD